MKAKPLLLFPPTVPFEADMLPPEAWADLLRADIALTLVPSGRKERGEAFTDTLNLHIAYAENAVLVEDECGLYGFDRLCVPLNAFRRCYVAKAGRRS